MAKFNKKVEPRVPTTINDMGEKAYELSTKEELVSTALTTFLADSYYESETEITKRLKTAISKVDPLFAAKVAIYARREANMRSVTHFIAGELASGKVTGLAWGKKFFEKIVQRPDDMSEILAYYFARNGKEAPISNAVKKGFKSKLENLDAYQLDKYKMERREISMIDLVNLFHPRPTTKNDKAYKALMKGESLAGLYSTKILEKTMSAAGQNGTSKADAIAEVLNNESGMPMFNLLRNLRNILINAPEHVEQALNQLMVKEKVLNSKLLPFRFATAYGEIEKLTEGSAVEKAPVIAFESDRVSTQGDSSKLPFAVLKQSTLMALERAMEYSCENIPQLEGNTAVLIDHSGSVRGDGGGSGSISAFSKVNTAMIGNLFGSMLAYSQNNTYIGMFGDRLIEIPIDRNIGVLKFNKKSYANGAACGGGTENGLYQFLEKCIDNKIKVDNLVIFSDMVIGSGGRGGWDSSSSYHSKHGRSFQDLFKAFKVVNPGCYTVSVNIRDTKGTSVFDKSLNVVQVSGWSDKIFDIISTNKTGYKKLVEEIENIVI